MNNEEIIAEVKSWWWNLSYLEIYDRLREGLDWSWHFPKGINAKDVGRLLSHAYNEESNASTASTFEDMAIHLETKFNGVEDAFKSAQEEDPLIDLEKIEDEIATAEAEVRRKQAKLAELTKGLL